MFVLVQFANNAYSFSAVIAKLFELGVPEGQWVSSEPWALQPTHEQEESK